MRTSAGSKERRRSISPFLGDPVGLATATGKSFANQRGPPRWQPARFTAFLRCPVATSMRADTSCVRSRRIPARRLSGVHPRSLNSGDFALGFSLCLLARSSQRLSQWRMTVDGGVLSTPWWLWSEGDPKGQRKPSKTTSESWYQGSFPTPSFQEQDGAGNNA